MIGLQNVAATSQVELYGYIHLDDGDSVGQLANHLIAVTNDATGETQEVYTDQYGFYTLPMTVYGNGGPYTDTLTLSVSYTDPETLNTIDGTTTILISDIMRADRLVA